MPLNLHHGIIQDKTIAGVPFEATIIIGQGNKANVRTGIPIQGPHSVTLHNTGNPNPTADARAHANWLASQEAQDQSFVGAHFFVDSRRIVQTLPLTEVAWHAGDGENGPGNRTSLAIEICETPPYDKAEAHAIVLAAALMVHYPNLALKKHQDWSGKYCPRKILDRGAWPQVSAAVFAERYRQSTTTTPQASHQDKQPALWAESATTWAQSQGLFKGDPDGNFRWHEPVTRQELAVILQRLEGACPC